MLKPHALRENSKIAVISPSGGAAVCFGHILQLGLENMNELLGFEPVVYPSVSMSDRELYLNPELRGAEINKAFEDPSIDGIITTIGGYDSIRILKYLDTEMILKNPKFIMGFSDATTFLGYLNAMGMVTFYGPSIMAGLAQLKHLPPTYIKHLKNFLSSLEIPMAYRPYESWTNGYEDWGRVEEAGKCKAMHPNSEGWEFVTGGEKATGRLWGGCIEVLEFMKGTEYWPRDEFWENRILVFETSEEKPSPMQVGYMLRNYGMQGILHQVKGIVIGRPKDYTKSEKDQLKHIIQDILKIELNLSHLPVVINVDFGHTDPKVILPMGCKVSLDPEENSIVLVEDPFKRV